MIGRPTVVAAVVVAVVTFPLSLGLGFRGSRVLGVERQDEEKAERGGQGF